MTAHPQSDSANRTQGSGSYRAEERTHISNAPADAVTQPENQVPEADEDSEVLLPNEEVEKALETNRLVAETRQVDGSSTAPSTSTSK